jgi:uncharacterized membrane protein
MKGFIKNMISKGDDVSHKRVLGTIGFLALVFALLTSVFYEVKPDSELVHAVEYLVISTVFGTVIEKFTNGKRP